MKLFLLMGLAASLLTIILADTLTWSDEFNGPDGSLPDANKWTYDQGGTGWGNNERQFYTNKTQNVKINGGKLVITATKTGASNYNCWYGPCQYTSARVLTLGKFSQKYGRIEARIRLPHSKGVWASFWLLGNDLLTSAWPNCGEIDIMELTGASSDTIHSTLHGPGYSGGNGVSASYTTPGNKWFSDKFHVFSMDWSADRISFAVDGTTFVTRTPADIRGNRWVYNHDFFIILNFAVGGLFPGDPDSGTPFPQSMLVDYVRVYQH